MLLKLEHIYKDYVQDKLVVPVLKDICFEVEKGEYVAIMGPSGSGKTTLMNIIGCLDTPTSGTYQLNGTDLLKFDDKTMAQIRNRSIGFVFQTFNLLPKQTALDNVALPLTYSNVPRKERMERAKQALEKVGLGDRMDFKPTQLSGGQKQRVAIARAIVTNPDLLLADEPTGALDSVSGKQIMELFAELNREGMTVLMITHDAQIAQHAGRMVTIYDGMLSGCGADSDAAGYENAGIEADEIASDEAGEDSFGSGWGQEKQDLDQIADSLEESLKAYMDKKETVHETEEGKPDE